MSIETHYSVADLVSTANSQLENVDCVSMDIFDTLFIRRVHNPDQIKWPVAKFIADVARQQGIQIDTAQCLDIRNQLEQEQRDRNGKTFPDHEARYDDFMQACLKEIFEERVPEDFFEEVAALEMRMESSVIVVRQELAAWLESLKQQQKRVLLISDIYLTSNYLQLLVDDNGLTNYVEGIISSADNFHAKASGATWPLIKERYGIDPERWIHVGDNLISDGSRPSEFGLRSYILKDLQEKHRHSVVKGLYNKTRHNALLRGRYIQQLMMPLEDENEQVPELYLDGYNFLGFVLGYYCLSILEHCRKNHINRIFFCSREGWTIQKVWDSMMPFIAPEGNYPESSYLYVSRIALAKASCARNGLSHLSAKTALLPASSRDFRDICRVFSLDFEPLMEHLERHDLSASELINPSHGDTTPASRRKFSELLGDAYFQDEVKRQARPAQLKLESYLNQEGFFDHPDVGLIDIGWLGTIQHYLVDAISHRLHKPRVHGLLLGATRVMPYRDNHESRVHGMLFDQGRFNFSESLITTIKDIFEESCRAPHPSVIGYERKYMEVEPVFRDVNDEVALQEAEQSKQFQPLRQGIFDAAPRFAAAMAISGYQSQQLRPWLHMLLTSRIAFPTSTEIARLRHESHQDDFAGSHVVPKAILKETRNLWDSSSRQFKWNPFIRFYYYCRHALRMLRN
ncbi:MAG: putative HAD superfamily hydrolase [Parasphingorhabdus sp.]